MVSREDPPHVPKAAVFVNGYVESVSVEPIRIHAGRIQIHVIRTHDVDGSPAGESIAPVDQVTRIDVSNKFELIAKLNELVTTIANTEGDFDGGSACIVIGRRYSNAALKRLRR